MSTQTDLNKARGSSTQPKKAGQRSMCFMTASPEKTQKRAVYKSTQKDPLQLALFPREDDPVNKKDLEDFFQSLKEAGLLKS